jgi:hypothetical protein
MKTAKVLKIKDIRQLFTPDLIATSEQVTSPMLECMHHPILDLYRPVRASSVQWDSSGSAAPGGASVCSR